jgi:TolB-like protein/Tfp pilus assembly protein PilF
MSIWSAEIKELEKLHESLKGQLPDLEKELERLIKADDENMILLYSRRCLEVIITDLCECELKRPRKTEPLKGIIDKLHKEEKVPAHIITSMHGLNELSTYGAHPKDFDPEQVKPVLNNLDIIIKWYLKYKGLQIVVKQKLKEGGYDVSHSDVSAIEKSIAVLPFVDMSPEKDQDYFCDGMAEEIINTLSHIENFKVIARTSAFAFKDKQVDIREIGRILGVETLLEGSIRKSDNRLRITAQLIKVADGSHIWSERYDRDMKDVFAIQDEISLAVADNLKFKLLEEIKLMAAKRHSDNLEAFNLYLKGTYCYQMMTAEGFKKGVEYFEQALQKDPKYGTAYAGLAAVLINSTAFGNVPPDKAYPIANKYVNKALKIDSTSTAAYNVLGVINTFYYWNWKEAEQNFKYSLEINPNRSLNHLYYSFLLTVTGRHEEAISEVKRAQELDPLSAYINTYTGRTFDYAGHFDRALEEYQMTLALNPNYFLAHFHLGQAYFAKSMLKEAHDEFEKAVELSSGNSFTTAFLIIACYQIGKKDQADKLFYNLKKRSETEYVPAISFYLIHRFREEESLALEWLKKSCKEHDIYLLWFRVNPYYIPKGSKYIALLKEMGLDY